MLMYVLVFLFFGVFSCSSEKGVEQNVVARVNDDALTKEMLNDLTLEGLRSPKELAHATNRWVEKRLLYNAAIKEGLKKDNNLIKKKETFYKNLLISSFLDIKTKKNILVKKKEVSAYYNKNKKSFTREEEEVFVKHFVLPTKKEGRRTVSILQKNKKGKDVEIFLKKHKAETKLLKRNNHEGGFVGFVFKGSVGDVLGPKKHKNSFHVFKIIKKHKKGSIRGLELVYDEIYQRLYKKKELERLSLILDSLYVNSDVYISPEVF